MNREQIVDGWYKVTDERGYPDFECVSDGRLDYGGGATVDECLSWGYTFEAAVVMTKADYDALVKLTERLP